MPAWNDLLAELDARPDDAAKAQFIKDKTAESLTAVSNLRGGRNVIFYASAFLQKPAAPAFMLSLSHEELNGFMSVIYGMDCTKGLTLLLHSPGGITNAAETIVAYLWSKFPEIEVIVPAYAMSAGTMISLSSSRIVMGRQSQLGPIDPQIPIGGRAISARSIVDQFDRAKADILTDLQTAHVWASILQSLGPGLLQEAQNALDYGEQMVSQWLEKRMFAGDPASQTKAKAVAAHFNDASVHKSHGRRIDRDEARTQGVIVEDLESSQPLQEAVLTAYHVVTILFEKGPATKLITSQTGKTWLKNLPS